MDTPDIRPLIEELTEDIDELEEALAPLLRDPLVSTANKLPLLDKAKLYALHTYAIESLLFSHLRLSGVDAKSHPVFTELTRVRQYFEKIKAAEAEPDKKKMTLDKGAANRFVRHALSGNDKYDQERKAQQQGQKASTQAKLEELTRRMEERKAAARAQGQKQFQEQQQQQKRKAESHLKEDSSDDDDSSDDNSSDTSSDSDADSDSDSSDGGARGGLRAPKEPAAKRQKTASPESSVALQAASAGAGGKGKGKSSGKQKHESKSRKQKSSHPPRGPSAAFQALLKGPLPKR